jgi:hypothetical protein
LFASKIDFLCMEPKPFGFHRTEAANNQIEQRNALIFARHPIGITNNQFSAMLTDVIHNVPCCAMSMPYWIDLIVQQMRTLNGFQKNFLSNAKKESFLTGSMGEGNCCGFLNLCTRITHTTQSLLRFLIDSPPLCHVSVTCEKV